MNKNSKIAILGYGAEGKSTERYLLNHGFLDIVVLNDKDIETKSKKIIGSKMWENLNQYDFIFRSPSILPNKKEFLNLDKNKLTSQMNFFYENCPTKNIIAITGTKGKGTTSTLIYEIFKQSNKKVFLGGNIGIPVLDFLDEVDEDSFVVLETSSFQSMDLKKSPHIAVILMTTQDHLDVHHDINEYIEAKANLIKHQGENDFCIFNDDYERSLYIASQSNANKLPFSNKNIFENYLKMGNLEIDLDKIKLPGRHNLFNILPALQVALLYEVRKEDIFKVLEDFGGLEMHLENVGQKNEVVFINDSFSTNPDTAMVALDSFLDSGEVVILLGGSDKGSDFDNLAKKISENQNIFAICYGNQGKKIADSIVKYCDRFLLLGSDFEEIVKIAFEKIENKKGTVLLSPACASFDMFDNYKNRGIIYNKTVRNIIKFC